MTWDKKCWGIFNNIYWEMRFAGMQGVGLTSELAARLREQNVPVPKGDSVYVRVHNDADHKKKLLSQEVVLNHFFNIAFDIADDTTVSELLCGPLGINDTGPFDSYNQGFGHERFGWPEQANVTQPDGFFFSSNSLIAVELKLESLTRLDQIAKYLAVMHLEEKHSGKRGNLGLLFIVPEKVRERIFSKIGMKGATIDSDFIARLKEVKLPLRLKTPAEELEGIAKRVRLASVSWTWLRDRLKQIESELDGRNRGEQTLLRLLRGLRTQIEKHGKTGIPRPSDRSS
jgi:hypothetical protein